MDDRLRNIIVEMTPEEYNQIERKSTYNNCTINDYVKRVALGKNLRDQNAEQRTETIRARVTPTELKTIEKKLKESNYTMSDFIRRTTLNKEIIIINELKEFSKGLRTIGTNLNQLAILSHQGKINSPNLYETRDKLDETWKLLNILITKTNK